MRQFIGIGDLAGNALIELLERGKTCSVTFEQLDEYGTQVKQYLRGKEEVVLLYHKNDVMDMKENYADFFTVKNFGQKNAYIELNKGVNKLDLWRCFRSPFSVKTMLAFMDDAVVKQSGLLIA